MRGVVTLIVNIAGVSTLCIDWQPEFLHMSHAYVTPYYKRCRNLIPSAVFKRGESIKKIMNISLNLKPNSKRY
jgi:hypothetical protein